MAGVTTLRKTQIGVETSPGSSTDLPTTIWRGTAALKDNLVVTHPSENVGKIGPTARSYIPHKEGAISLVQDATFEQLAYILNAAFYAATPTTDTGSGYIRTWNSQYNSTDPLSASDLSTLVVEDGNNQQAELAHYGVVMDYTLSGVQGEGLKLEANLFSQAPAVTTFTAVGDTDLDNPAEVILMSLGSMAIDASSDVPGTTAATETILEFAFKHVTGWVPLPARTARLDFSNVKHIDDQLALDVKFEHNSVAVAEKAAWRNQTERVIQLKFIGSALAVGGVYTTKTLILNLYGKWDTFGAVGLEDQNGDNIYSGTFKVAYCTAPAAKAQIVLVHDVQTLP